MNHARGKLGLIDGKVCEMCEVQVKARLLFNQDFCLGYEADRREELSSRVVDKSYRF